jgi:hypothetical protein
VLARYAEVRAAYLFGSFATGKARSDSDVDLALVCESTDPGEIRVAILADLTAEGLDRVDLIVLDEADTVLRFEAVHPNCLVYARQGFDHGSYFSRSLREYFDLEPYLRIQREAFRERLLHGAS